MHIQAKRELFFLKSVKKYNCRNNIVIRLIKEMRQVGSKAFFTFTSKNGLNKPFYYFFRKSILKKTMKASQKFITQLPILVKNFVERLHASYKN